MPDGEGAYGELSVHSCDDSGYCLRVNGQQCKHRRVYNPLSLFPHQSTETSSSHAMELEGLIRCRAELTSEQVDVGSLTSDRHVSVDKYMRTDWKDCTHFFDTWHICKGITLTASPAIEHVSLCHVTSACNLHACLRLLSECDC